MKIRYLFAAILMTFALAFAASSNGMSVARGPTITAVISVDLMPLPADIDSLLIAELGVQYGYAELNTDNIISKHNIEVLSPSMATMGAGALSGYMLAGIFKYAFTYATAVPDTAKNEGVSLYGDVGV